MKSIQSRSFANPIIFTKFLQGGELLVVDSQTTFMILDSVSLEVKNRFIINIPQTEYQKRIVDCTSDMNYFTAINPELKDSRLFNLQTRTAVPEVSTHSGEVSCVGIDPKNLYMFSCEEDGKVCIKDIQNGELLFTIAFHTDSVNDIVFSENGNWVATASYDKKIALFNLERMTLSHKLIGHTAPVIRVQFLDEQRVFSVDKDSNGFVWDIQTSNILKSIDGLDDKVVQVTIDGENKFLFLGTQLGYIFVYDMQTYEKLSKKYLKLNSAITSLSFNKEKKHLIITTQNCEIFVYHIYEGETTLDKFVKNKTYDLFYLLVEKNLLLKYTNAYASMEVLWETTLQKVKIALDNGHKQIAIDLFKNFKNIPDKNEIIHKMIHEYTEFDKFVLLAKEGKISLAYAFANNYPSYKSSSIYNALEIRWRKSFLKAQKYAFDPNGQEHMLAILTPYRRIPHKINMIEELFSKAEIYRKFRVTVEQRNFQASFELIRLYPFLKELSEYKLIINYGNALYLEAKKLIEEEKITSAMKLLRVLENFPDLHNDVQKKGAEIEAKRNFLDAIKKKNHIVAYNLLSVFESLQETQEGNKLQKQWNHDLAKANESAFSGNTKGIKEALAFYMNIESKYASIGTLFGWAYMIQLEQAVQHMEPQKTIEIGIKKYILSFGLQDQILSFYEFFKMSYPQSKLNLALQTKGSLSMWRPSMGMNSILG